MKQLSLFGGEDEEPYPRVWPNGILFLSCSRWRAAAHAAIILSLPILVRQKVVYCCSSHEGAEEMK